MENFERDTIRQLAKLEEQNYAMMRTLDEMRKELAKYGERVRKLEFAAQFRSGVVAVIAVMGSIFGGLAVAILQWILGVK